METVYATGTKLRGQKADGWQYTWTESTSANRAGLTGPADTWSRTADVSSPPGRFRLHVPGRGPFLASMWFSKILSFRSAFGCESFCLTYSWWRMLTRLNVMITLQYIQASNHCATWTKWARRESLLLGQTGQMDTVDLPPDTMHSGPTSEQWCPCQTHTAWI